MNLTLLSPSYHTIYREYFSTTSDEGVYRKRENAHSMVLGMSALGTDSKILNEFTDNFG